MRSFASGRPVSALGVPLDFHGPACQLLMRHRLPGGVDQPEAGAGFQEMQPLVDQLGARAGSRRAVEVRLGAIVALQNYPEQAGPDDSREREEALGTVMTVLAAYVRTNSPLRRDRASAPGGGSQPPPLLPGCLGRAPIRPSPRFSPDVSAAIAGFVDTTRKYRTASLGYGLTTVDLSHTDLRGADFSGADVKRATFEGSDLARAAFHYADLDEAVLDGVDARNVCFYAAQLDRASLEGALLDGAAVCASFLDRLPRGRRVQRMSRIAGC